MSIAGWPAYVQASAAWHGAMGLGAALAPAAWPWWLGGVAANHLLISGASMIPRSSLIGPNITRLPGTQANANRIALTFDDGPDPDVTPHVLALLGRAGARATFFCIGERLTRYPALGQQIVAEGHSIENHTQTHSHRFAFRGPQGLRNEIAGAQQTAVNTVGAVPRFFRAPAGMRNPFLQPVLADLGLQLVSWTRRGFDTRNNNDQSVLARLKRNLAGGDILLLHDGHAAHTADGKAIVLCVLPALLEQMADRQLHCVPLREALR